MEADDFGTYVVKFRGAGQGRKALIAEVISAGIARACGLPVPDLVAVELDPALAPGEPDQEIQDLLRASDGLNLGVDFLPGALDLDPGASTIDATLASRIIWFDALNPMRTGPGAIRTCCSGTAAFTSSTTARP